MMRTSSSADRLRFEPLCRTGAIPRRSDSFSHGGCRMPRCPGSEKKNNSVTVKGEEWDALAKGLRTAFLRSSAISGDHPAASVLAACDPARLSHELFDKGQWTAGAYTRTLLLDGDGFNVMLLCWAPGCASPVHAHSCSETGNRSNCFLLVLEGELAETVYGEEAILPDNQTVDARLGRTRKLTAGRFSYINDSVGLHKVSNPSNARAVTLHVYAPGWKHARLFEEQFFEKKFEEKFPEVDAGGAELDCETWGDY